MPIKVLIVDDEYPSRQELRCILEEITNIEIVAECRSGDEAYRKVQECDVDAVFLDIQMITMTDGLVAAEKIKQVANAPKIVFTTGYSEFAIRAFELNATDYLLKPYSKERVEVTIERLTQDEAPDRNAISINPFSRTDRDRPVDSVRVPVWHNDRLIVFQPPEIFFAKAEQKRKTSLCTEKGTYVTNMPLKEVQLRLEPYGFFRCHKSFLVNLHKVREITPWFNGTYTLSIEGCPVKDIPVARHFIKDFKHAMGIDS